ncbi:ATP-dependent DNA helicase RecG [Paenibacillus sp. J31TS4]|uniref:ATP-dependent DNA helicase RecG n=1 Tax=Paenibacillus sp. J31TS4 TaxID=2807195 RepID=UPI001B2D006D|nr:ATP-dependent DNA helicase RecG [Paenibacillus sp. J31TS4]GIP36747.1 ATP-dependent DNA helicase RecG [Paenibacillus sp. J31TS4]
MEVRQIPVRQVKGVGPKKAEDLLLLGIETAEDLLEYYPFRYEDYSLKDLSQVKDGERVTVEGTVYGMPALQMYGRKKSRLSCKVVVDRFVVTAVWFNQGYLKERLVPGETIVLTGKWDGRRLQITVAECEFPGREGAARTDTLQPVYSIAGPITQSWLRKTIAQALETYGPSLPETLPPGLLAKHGLMPRGEAIRILHQPTDAAEGKRARKRIAYEELFLFQLKMQAYRALSRSKSDGVALPVDHPAVRAFVRSLPFTLTGAQKKVIAELLEDLKQPHAMNRLLQGDVGAGKTVVAAVCLFAVVKAGYQGALMVPTEILAEQHKRSLEKLFAPYGIQVALLTGSLTDRKRREILDALQMGLIDVVVGTHALIQEDVFFRSLGLVITDEQHRFGVNQRAILRRKGLHPDVLMMTATPIPRTLAITAFGDMDVSTLDELPKGRKPIKTYCVPHTMLERVLGFIRREVAAGRQAYVICPLIEESDKLDVQNAIDVHAQLTHHFPDLKVGLLHGRLPNAEKEELMRAFSENQLQVLVSTTVIEVGVDVPNASLMIIYDAVRFGLSQLHQLRGRVGRGEHQSYCVLIADPKNEISKERMRVMTETNDGFEIARRDLELRGPGEFFGTRQSGVPEFKVADMVSDFELLEQAREDAAELVSRPDFWTAAEWLPLRDYLQKEQVFQGAPFD